jgi:hypothetical protein
LGIFTVKSQRSWRVAGAYLTKRCEVSVDNHRSSALIYAWTNELDLAFETLDPLTKRPAGGYYGDLTANSLSEPLRKDPRYQKLLGELAPLD